jgi:hypothetical protein
MTIRQHDEEKITHKEKEKSERPKRLDYGTQALAHQPLPQPRGHPGSLASQKRQQTTGRGI